MANLSINSNIVVIASSETINKLNKVVRFNTSFNELKKMPKEERRLLKKEAEEILDLGDVNSDMWDDAYKCYFNIDAIEQDDYYNDNIDSLISFYENHISGHSVEELELGNKICMLGYDLYHSIPAEMKKSGYVFADELCEYYISEYMKIYGGDHDSLVNAVNLSRDWEYYSDYHKDVHGFRPHFCV